MRTLTLVLLFFIIATHLSAQDDPIIDTDRPGQCYSSVTIPKGYLQLETGIGLDLMNGMDSWGLTVTDFRFGVAKNFELKTGVRSSMTKIHGFDELSFDGSLMAGLKWGIVNKKVQVGYVAEAHIPLYPSIVKAQHLINVSHAVGKKMGFYYMLSHNYDFSQLKQSNYGGGLQFSYLISFALLEKWTFYIEGSSMWDSSSPSSFSFLYDAGLMYLVKDNLQIDIFFGHGINYAHGTYGIGICWLPLKEKKPQNTDIE